MSPKEPPDHARKQLGLFLVANSVLLQTTLPQFGSQMKLIRLARVPLRFFGTRTQTQVVQTPWIKTKEVACIKPCGCKWSQCRNKRPVPCATHSPAQCIATVVMETCEKQLSFVLLLSNST